MFKKFSIKVNSKNILSTKLKKEFEDLEISFKKYDLVVYDLSNKKFKRFKFHYNFLQKVLKKGNTKFGIIDSLGKDQIFNHKFFKFVNIPYFFTKNDLNKSKTKYFYGPEFLFDDQKYFKNKKENNKLENILITAGGSDLNNSIIKIIKLLKSASIIEKKFHILIGPFFKKNYIDKIKALIKINNIKSKFLEYKEKISQSFKNIDIIITSAGLTKYNALNTNIPFISYCENEFQRKLHRGFEKKNYCLTLENLKLSKKNISSIQKFFLQSKFRNKFQIKRAKFLRKKRDIKYFFQFIKYEI